jgi:hypothetical protein
VFESSLRNLFEILTRELRVLLPFLHPSIIAVEENAPKYRAAGIHSGVKRLQYT